MLEFIKEHKALTVIVAIILILVIMGIFVAMHASDPKEYAKAMVESELNRLTQGEATVREYEFSSVENNGSLYTIKGVVRFTSMVDYNELTFYADFEVEMTKESSDRWVCERVALDLLTD